MHYNYFKRITDQYIMDVPIKGGHVRWTPKLIILTTNRPMREWWDNVPDADAAALKRRVMEFEFFGHVNPVHDKREWERLDAYVADVDVPTFEAHQDPEVVPEEPRRAPTMHVDDSSDEGGGLDAESGSAATSGVCPTIDDYLLLSDSD